jgi:hypothetical protein
MNKVKNILLFFVIIFFSALAGMSVYGAFIGPYQTKFFFYSPVLTFFWLIFVIFLFISLFFLGNPFRSPSLFLIHVAVICIIIGAMSGSAVANKLMKKYLGIDKMQRGTLQIYKGQSQNFAFDADEANSTQPSPAFKQLPFSIKLKDFRIEFYEPGTLYIETPQKQLWQIEAKEGIEQELGANAGTIKVLKVFKNLQMTTENGKATADDRPEAGFNAAVQIEYKTIFGSTITKYVFEGFENPVLPDDKISVSFKRPGIKDFFSDIEIIKDGRVVSSGTIEINKPFYYGGFYFYQFDYDRQAGQFTVLQVVSDTGLAIVYAGFAILALGAFWHFWFQNIINFSIKSRTATNAN